jgi:hypothetical protein
MFIRNPSSLLNINLDTNFKCVKRMDSQISNLITQRHDLLIKLGFIKFASPKHVIFERSCKLHHIPYLTTTNYLWLHLITLFRCSPIVWKPQRWRIIYFTKLHSFGKEGKLVFRILISKDGHEGLAKNMKK